MPLAAQLRAAARRSARAAARGGVGSGTRGRSGTVSGTNGSKWTDSITPLASTREAIRCKLLARRRRRRIRYARPVRTSLHRHAHVAQGHLGRGGHRVHHAGLEVNLDPAVAVGRRRPRPSRRRDLRPFHDRVGQQFPGGPLDLLGRRRRCRSGRSGAWRSARRASPNSAICWRTASPDRVHRRLARRGPAGSCERRCGKSWRRILSIPAAAGRARRRAASPPRRRPGTAPSAPVRRATAARLRSGDERLRLQSSSSKCSLGMTRKTSSVLVSPRATFSSAAWRNSSMPFFDGLGADFAGGRPFGDQVAEGGGDGHDLEDAGAAGVAGHAASSQPLAA